MTSTTPGASLPSTNATREWFKFWKGYLGADEDPRFRHTWERGVAVGQRLAIERTAQWAGLVPLLQDVLDYLVALAIEKEAEKYGSDEAEP